MFSNDFLWGAASASAQIEGAWNLDGKVPSIWDTANPKKIKHRELCLDGCDHYHHYKDDVKLMKEIGLKSYRFSLSWCRIIFENGEVNPQGIAFYNRLIDELIAHDIEPLVTIYHWDLPVWVHKKGGWLSRRIVRYFNEYVKVVVDHFSDRVKYWIVMNEPQCFIMNGYMQGVHAPFKHRYLALAKLTRHCMEAFSEGVKTIRTYAKTEPKVGIAMAAGAFVPEHENPQEIEEARKTSFDFGSGLMANKWWCDPLLLGKGVRAFGVYHISDAFAQKVCQPLDFLGLNNYAPYNDAEWGGDKKKKPDGMNRNVLGWAIDGRVLYWCPKFMYERYKLPIMITENGYAGNDFIGLDNQVHDYQRSYVLHTYLQNLKRATDEGIPILGYQHWSIMDNYEWAEGFSPRFGLIHVDYQTKKRTLKQSAFDYKKIIANNGSKL